MFCSNKIFANNYTCLVIHLLFVSLEGSPIIERQACHVPYHINSISNQIETQEQAFYTFLTLKCHEIFPSYLLLFYFADVSLDVFEVSAFSMH